ncbi:conserved protein of unknown function [Limnospira indica PCC 8005]|uniref:Uncharacterized protein n=1 Tax=Limnospira indica PCC 8005 TaxID=376219 RepID=A0A9P1KKP9_9CYAN|nr:conserved protein of unknown function [Limnospira indica PCC 8005]
MHHGLTVRIETRFKGYNSYSTVTLMHSMAITHLGVSAK